MAKASPRGLSVFSGCGLGIWVIPFDPVPVNPVKGMVKDRAIAGVAVMVPSGVLGQTVRDAVVIALVRRKNVFFQL